MKNLLFAICVFCAYPFVQQSVIAQQPKTNVSPEAIEWQRVQSDNGEFSIELPKNCSYFYEKDGFSAASMNSTVEHQLTNVQMLNCYQDQTLTSVEVYNTKNPKAIVERLYRGVSDKAQPRVKKTRQGKFEIRDSTKQTQQSLYNAKYIISKTHIYVLTTATRNQSSATGQRFFASLRLSDDGSTAKDTLISSLKNAATEFVIERPENSPAKDETTNAEDKSVKPFVILNKIIPNYTESARNKGVRGTVRFRVTFSENGNISKLVILNSLPGNLTREAIFTALRTRFLPSEKDDKPISVTKVVEYGFNMYLSF